VFVTSWHASYLKGDGSLKRIRSDHEQEEEETAESGRPPRRRSALLLGLVGVLGILLGLAVVFFFAGPSRKSEKTTTSSTPQTQVPAREGSLAEKSDSGPSPGLGPTAPSADQEKLSAEQLIAEIEAAANQGKSSPEEASRHASQMPFVALPADGDPIDLQSLVFPPLPYCIYAGAYRELQEAETTRSELESNYMAAYILPVEVSGNVGQSLFGVTQDGTWYRVLTGHFGSKEEARKTLGVMMEELPGYQPEILRFPYALECGRFLVTEEARLLAERLDRERLFPYAQTYPTSEGMTVTRILVGCFFSEQGATGQQQDLNEKNFSCEIVER